MDFKQLASWEEQEYLRGDGFEPCEFETLTLAGSLIPTQHVISCVRDTAANSA